MEMRTRKEAWLFTTAKGECPYNDFLRELKRAGIKTKRIEALVVKLSEWGMDLAETDLVDHVEGKIWELKPDPFRIFFYEVEKAFILLNGYRKKGERIPDKHLNKARRLFQEAMEEMEGA